MKLFLNLLGFKKVLIMYVRGNSDTIHVQKLLELRKKIYNADIVDFVISENEDIKIFYSLY